MARNNGKVTDLPDQTQPRILALVERSSPNIDKPPLPPGVERNFDATERKTAACYADIEETTFRLRRIAKRLAAGGKIGVAR